MNDNVAENRDPIEPKLSIMNVDLLGAPYTNKLALHYLRFQPGAPRAQPDPGVESCWICEKQGSPQYNAAKYGVRGLSFFALCSGME